MSRNKEWEVEDEDIEFSESNLDSDVLAKFRKWKKKGVLRKQKLKKKAKRFDDEEKA